MSCEDFKYLPRITAFDKVLRDKAFNIEKNSKYDRYNVDLLLCSTNFLIKKTFCRAVENKIMSNKELAEKLHKTIIRKF